MAEGYCKLTGQWGKFVKSHLIPKALTSPGDPGLPLIQAGRGARPTRRWDSWYDGQLVTRAGEDILTALDTWAITTLRHHKLIWSGWGPMQRLSVRDHKHVLNGETGVRKIDGIDPHRARLFFLSLLWRAAATARDEFAEVTLPPDDLEVLRRMLLDSNPEPLSFYPVQLTQLSMLGTPHNQSPLAESKTIPAAGEHPEQTIPFYRFYFDGLIVHVHRHASDNGYTRSLGPLFVGADSSLFVTTVPYETSYQRNNLLRIQAETLVGWQEVIRKL